MPNSARQMTAQTTKQGTLCSVQEDGAASPGRCRSLWEILKVSDNKVTHHSYQKGAFGLNGDVSFTREGHCGDSMGLQDSSRFPKILQDSPFGPLRGVVWRPWAPGPPLFFVFVFAPPPAPSRSPDPPLTERSKTLGHGLRALGVVQASPHDRHV